jgi:hypothetical protein
MNQQIAFLIDALRNRRDDPGWFPNGQPAPTNSALQSPITQTDVDAWHAANPAPVAPQGAAPMSPLDAIRKHQQDLKNLQSM